MVKLNTYLNFTGNAEEAFNFYKSIFGGEFSSVMRYKDMASMAVELSTADENKIMNIILPVGKDDMLMGSDVMESRGRVVKNGNNVRISIMPESKDEAEKLFNALSAGGTIEIPMSDEPWNAYYGSFKDKYGINWMINYAYKPEERKAEPAGAHRVL
jgi:PhnB protein